MKACNGAGLSSHDSSNGVLIDNSGPIPGLVVVGGTWSSRKDTVISNENAFNVKLVKDDQLRLGDIYIVKLTACNAALLCNTAYNEEVLLDYSPPHIGGFMPPLNWEVIPGTTNSIIFHLTWYRFSDVESEIRSYFISKVCDYTRADIIGAYQVKPDQQDPGDMQHTTINIDTTNKLPEKLVFIICAENHAGLLSSRSKITTDVKHSCVAEYCNNDCTCGQKCKADSKSKCNIKTDNNGMFSISVKLIVPTPDIETKYYTTVRAINNIGLQTELSSDGFVIDDIAPIAGIVYNTEHHRDAIYQSNNQPVQFFWHCFDDERSFIDSYNVGCIVNVKGSLVNNSFSFQKFDIHDHIVYDGNLNQ
ncbi:unnamed protein product [Mytilus coruscus]|uniref:Uncharacterized protein n=1 Tax=Mytilus coruscus TaxID=42192 RepID=A0A6J8CNT0_MYTCO|nr:unnamed protein product [Mytilus coruscus]